MFSLSSTPKVSTIRHIIKTGEQYRMLFFYTFTLWLLLPYIFLHLLWRARKQPEYLRHVKERFGFYSIQVNNPIIWLHAVSVGETRATQNLVTRLRASYPHHQILITHATPTGRATSKELYGDSVWRVYLPYDYPFAVRKFLRHFRPQLGILLETEIWFNLTNECHKVGVPLLLLNARMSEKSARGYVRFSRLTHRALGKFTSIAAQTHEDASRLTGLGAKNVSVMGNLKFDIKPPQAQLQLGKQLRAQFGMGRKIFLAASTREGEEVLLLDALKNIHIPNLLVVIVPRHPQRFADIANLLKQRGILFQRRSKNTPVSAETQVVLGDSMGEMFAYYCAADLAFVGGSLLPYGGQNLIEACAVGTPVLVGPYTYNFTEITLLAISAGATDRAKDATEIIAKLQHLLEDPAALSAMRLQGIKFVESNHGATEVSLQIIRNSLPILSG
jgi:3-deoxy-D-manno-octulosonic-acid transferase